MITVINQKKNQVRYQPPFNLKTGSLFYTLKHKLQNLSQCLLMLEWKGIVAIKVLYYEMNKGYSNSQDTKHCICVCDLIDTN